MNTVTGIILNWRRPENVVRILAGWRASGAVSEAIVWNNNAETTFRHPWAMVVNAAPDMGLYTRFAAACLARTECVLIQDDDLELVAGTLEGLLDAWRREPDVLHGVFGRAPKFDGSYARNVLGDAECPVVLTRVLVAHRDHAARFFAAAPRFEDIQREGRPAGNGEDIIFSHVAMRSSGRLNRVHQLAVRELPAPHAIHSRDWRRHIAHRTKLLRACQAWLRQEQEAFA